MWPLHELGEQARSLVDEFWEVNPQVQSALVRRSLVHWSPPPHDHYKVNFDATFFAETRLAGVGVVVRDYDGQIIGALWQNIGSVQSIEMAEALATRRVVRFAAELCVFQVIIEGDCNRVIATLKGFGRYRTLFGHIIDESKKIRGMLRSCLFQHVQHEGNRLAHCLAKKAVLSADIDVWVESLPEDVEDVFHSDLGFLNNISLTFVSKKKELLSFFFFFSFL